MQNVVFERIQKDISENDVVLYMKGSAAFPQCGFSAAVAQILAQLGVSYKDVNVLEDKEIWQGVKDFTNWPTIPQLYVKGEFVGGCDITREMYESGELQQLLKDKGVAFKAAA
jgi:monothiol glutaredoxin